MKNYVWIILAVVAVAVYFLFFNTVPVSTQSLTGTIPVESDARATAVNLHDNPGTCTNGCPCVAVAQIIPALKTCLTPCGNTFPTSADGKWLVFYSRDACTSMSQSSDRCQYACFQAQSPPPPTTVPGDSNGDGIVSRAELGDFISQWMAGTATRSDLGTAIANWMVH